MEEEQKWYVGIDFGTSNTYIVGYEKISGKIFHTDLMDMDIRTTEGIPTVIAVDVVLDKELQRREDFIYVGKEALQHPALHIERNLKSYARRYNPGGQRKEFLDHKYIIEFGRQDEEKLYQQSVQNLLVTFFKKIFEKIDKKYDITKDTIQKIVIGRPTRTKVSDTVAKGTTIEYDKVLIKAITDCFIEEETKKNDFKIEVIPEAELAGLAYTNNCEPQDVILVVDLGGGTTDFSLVYRDENNKIEATCIGDKCDVAGNKVDSVIKEAVDSVMKKEANGRSMPKETCRKKKEAMFQTKENTPRSTLELSTLDINFDSKVIAYSYLEEREVTEQKKGFKEEVYNQITTKLESALKDDAESILRGRKINKILFVGGTSMITPLRECIEAAVKKSGCAADSVSSITLFDKAADGAGVQYKFGRDEKAVTLTCYNAVALGACMKAMSDNNIYALPKLEFRWDGETWESVDWKDGIAVMTDASEDVKIADFCLWQMFIDVRKRNGMPLVFYLKENNSDLSTKVDINLEKVDSDLIVRITMDKNGEIYYSAGTEINNPNTHEKSYQAIYAPKNKIEIRR